MHTVSLEQDEKIAINDLGHLARLIITGRFFKCARAAAGNSTQKSIRVVCDFVGKILSSPLGYDSLRFCD